MQGTGTNYNWSASRCRDLAEVQKGLPVLGHFFSSARPRSKGSALKENTRDQGRTEREKNDKSGRGGVREKRGRGRGHTHHYATVGERCLSRSLSLPVLSHFLSLSVCPWSLVFSFRAGPFDRGQIFCPCILSKSGRLDSSPSIN